MTSTTPFSDLNVKGLGWQRELARAFRKPAELLHELGLSEEYASMAAHQSFPVFAPRPFVSRIQPGNPDDPLLRQVLPVDRETDVSPTFTSDPVGDLPATRKAGLIQKYAGRVLLILSRTCPVHCRYCFRRHFPYNDTPVSIAEWRPVLHEIAKDHSIDEVILSGGDPLMQVDGVLEQIVRMLEQIDPVKRLRIHTRMPMMIPSRVDARLLRWIELSRLRVVTVVHVNHASEIDEEVESAFGRLRRAGSMLFNQSVLLRGVNDCAATLIELSRRLIGVGVMPYYLNQLDRVRGAAHFEVPIETGREIIEQMRRELPGYAVPRYVQEVPGQAYKVSINA